MVAGFISLLNVALMMAVVEQTPISPFDGVTTVTMGAVVEAAEAQQPGLFGSPHPAAKMSKKSDVNHILGLPCFRMHAFFRSTT
jgi:hypothetical protein